ncbi:MAG: ATP-binding cassette domain-containing protein [Mobilicoccus sp.]|nr:ATP-binding cassette domain-containing protein [Mobilicoccus sp.]
MSGALDWRGRYAARDHETSLRVEAGRTVALVGPNGAGKSTMLDLIAGVLAPDEASLSIGETVLHGEGAVTPPHRRGIAVLGQDPLLFPHLRVQANVEFGPRAQGEGRAEARRRAAEMLERLDLVEFARRYPAQLSGGQAARVALARALAVRPRSLLLDEPFAALDVDVAPRIRQVVAEQVRAAQVPVVLVTHDLIDVLALADDIAVVEAGRIVEHGRAADVLAAPTSTFAAGLAGVNHVRGRLVGPGTLEGEITVHGRPASGVSPGSDVVAVWSPAAVALYRAAPTGSPRNVWAGEVVDLADRGGVVRVTTRIPPGLRVAADLSPAAVRELALSPGDRVVAVVKAQEVALHPARPTRQAPVTGGASAPR